MANIKPLPIHEILTSQTPNVRSSFTAPSMNVPLARDRSYSSLYKSGLNKSPLSRDV